MIKLTKNTAAQILKERLNQLVVVRHIQGDSYDRDLIIWNKKKNKCNIDDVVFLDLSSDYLNFIIRSKWNYDGKAKLIPDFNLYCFKKNRKYVKINLKFYNDREDIWYTISERMNIVIKLLNFIKRNKANGVTYEIYNYMRDVVKDYERLVKKNLI